MAEPTNYKEMTYDKTIHWYIPTKEGIEKGLSTQLESLTHMFDGTNAVNGIKSDIDNWLKEIAMATQDWMLSETAIDNVDYIEYAFAYDVKLQQILFTAYLDMARYDIRSGGLLVWSQHGINIERAVKIKIEELRGRVLVASGAEKKLRRTGLITSMSLPYTVDPAVYRVEY